MEKPGTEDPALPAAEHPQESGSASSECPSLLDPAPGGSEMCRF